MRERMTKVAQATASAGRRKNQPWHMVATKQKGIAQRRSPQELVRRLPYVLAFAVAVWACA